MGRPAFEKMRGDKEDLTRAQVLELIDQKARVEAEMKAIVEALEVSPSLSLPSGERAGWTQ